MNLTDREKEIIKAHIDRGEALPAKNKLMLFEVASCHPWQDVFDKLSRAHEQSERD